MAWIGSAPNKTTQRTDGTRTGSTVFAEQKTAGIKIRADLSDIHAQDIADMINECMRKDGGNYNADADLNGNKFADVGDASARTHFAAAGQIADGELIYAGTSAGTDTITATLSPAITAYVGGMLVVFRAGGTNTGAATLNLNSVGAIDIKKGAAGTTALAAGDITSGGLYVVAYNGTTGDFELLNPSFVASADITANAVTTAKILDDNVTNAKLANMAESTIKGRAASAGTGDPTDLSVAQVLTLLGAVSSGAIQTFTGNGTYTPAAGMKFCIALVTGGGGGGGGADTSGTNSAGGAGGGAGGTAIGIFSAATIGASQAVTIGAAGTGGANTGGNGGAGGDSTLGALLTGSGGAAGSGTLNGVSGAGVGGAASSGSVNITGGSGTNGIYVTSVVGVGGNGGASFWGGGGKGSLSGDGESEAGAAGAAFGSGGGGASARNNSSGSAGGAGKAGVCVIIEFV